MININRGIYINDNYYRDSLLNDQGVRIRLLLKNKFPNDDIVSDSIARDGTVNISYDNNSYCIVSSINSIEDEHVLSDFINIIYYDLRDIYDIILKPDEGVG